MGRGIGLLQAVLVSCAWFWNISFAVQQEDYSLMMGPHFSPPDAVGPTMDQAWHQRTIEHEAVYSGSDLVLKVDQQIYPMFLDEVNRYAGEKGLKISFVEGTCGVAAGGLRNKNSDIVGLCCPPAPIDRFPGVQFHTIGITPLAFLVNRNNPVDNLSLNELRGIYSGAIYDWSQTADGKRKGFSGAITAVTRLHCKVRPGHWKLLIGSEDDFSPLISDVGAIPDVMQQVRSDLNAVGYADPDQVSMYATQTEVKIIHVNGIDINDADAVTEKHYPIYRVHSLTTWNQGSDQSKVLVDHLIRHANSADSPKYRYLTPSDRLRAAGWKFNGNEVIGEPEGYR